MAYSSFIMFDILLLVLHACAQISTSVKSKVIIAMPTRPAPTPTGHTSVSARLVSMATAEIVNVSVKSKAYGRPWVFIVMYHNQCVEDTIQTPDSS